MTTTSRRYALVVLLTVSALAVGLLTGLGGAPGAARAHAATAVASSGACATATAQVASAKKAHKKAKKRVRKLKKKRKALTKRIKKQVKAAAPKKRIRLAKKKRRKVVQRLRKNKRKVRRAKKRYAVSRTAVTRLCARGTTTRVSVASNGRQANGRSGEPAISGNDRFVAFTSAASNLVGGDTNGHDDVFVHDLVRQQTERVSLTRRGGQGNGPSTEPAISADGRYVAFTSTATDLVAGDTNNRADVFVRDRVTARTTRVSVTSAAGQADGDSFAASISADGRHVAFTSEATNLTSQDTRGTLQVYVHDRATGVTQLVSHAPGGAVADGRTVEPAISADGNFIAYSTEATNLGAVGATWEPDVFVWSRRDRRSYVASVDGSGRLLPGWSVQPTISATGRYVAFERRADLVTRRGVTLRDRTGRVTTSLPGAESIEPSLSADGRYLALSSADWQVRVHDRVTGADSVVSLSTTGAVAESYAGSPSISADGRSVAFVSTAENLVAGDSNRVDDVFVRRR